MKITCDYTVLSCPTQIDLIEIQMTSFNNIFVRDVPGNRKDEVFYGKLSGLI